MSKSEELRSTFFANKDHALLKAYQFAGNAAKGADPAWVDERTTIATYIQEAFNNMRAGISNPQQWEDYKRDVDHFYSPLESDGFNLPEQND